MKLQVAGDGGAGCLAQCRGGEEGGREGPGRSLEALGTVAVQPRHSTQMALSPRPAGDMLSSMVSRKGVLGVLHILPWGTAAAALAARVLGYWPESVLAAHGSRHQPVTGTGSAADLHAPHARLELLAVDLWLTRCPPSPRPFQRRLTEGKIDSRMIVR